MYRSYRIRPSVTTLTEGLLIKTQKFMDEEWKFVVVKVLLALTESIDLGIHVDFDHNQINQITLRHSVRPVD